LMKSVSDVDEFVHLLQDDRADEDMIRLFSANYYGNPIQVDLFHKHYEGSANNKYATWDEMKIANEALLFNVIEKENLIGHVQINRRNNIDHTANIAFVYISKEKRLLGGYGEAMMRQTCKLAADELAMKELKLFVFPENTTAIKCYERVGFSFVEMIDYENQFFKCKFMLMVKKL